MKAAAVSVTMEQQATSPSPLFASSTLSKAVNGKVHGLRTDATLADLVGFESGFEGNSKRAGSESAMPQRTFRSSNLMACVPIFTHRFSSLSLHGLPLELVNSARISNKSSNAKSRSS